MPSTRSKDPKDTTLVHTSALQSRTSSRRAQSAQPTSSTRQNRSTRSTSLYPRELEQDSSPSPASDTLVSIEDTTETSSRESESEETETNIDKSGEEIILKEGDMFNSNERSGLRGRNVEDVSLLEEEGLLRRVESRERTPTRASPVSHRGSPKGKEKEFRMEKAEFVQNEGDEGLNNPRDRNAFALLVLLCRSRFL